MDVTAACLNDSSVAHAGLPHEAFGKFVARLCQSRQQFGFRMPYTSQK
jgi:hypothetical protein